MNKVVIVSGARTPLGKFGGKLKDIKAPQLGAYALQGAIEKINMDPNDIELVIMGNVLQAGLGQNPARQSAFLAGIGKETPAFTINEVCGSGLKTVHLAMQAIKLGEQDIVAVGGFENMSQSPYILKNSRFGANYNNLELKDLLHHDGLLDVYSGEPMGITAENIATLHNITREQQDQYAYMSTQRAIKAIESGVFEDEIVPVAIKGGVLTQDEGVRFDTSLEKLSKLRPAFKENGSVTAGNASTLNDGAAALILMSEKEALRRGLRILSYVEDYQEIGMDPSLMGYAPFYAINKLVKKNNIDLNAVDLFEINEAFSAQMIAVINDLKLDINKVNVNGGGISLGHPIGTSGARIVVSLVHQMNRDNLSEGIASICMGGGMGSALLLHRK
jgi:acetyl-CoA C-acetyltransferase